MIFVKIHLVSARTFRDVKERLGGLSDPGLLRLIFAWRELSDQVSEVSCDLGHRSHHPLVQTLCCDLQLTSGGGQPRNVLLLVSQG